ncbi:sugar phosphate isomerase/epimerase [Enterococcus saccharolyticus]|uniref:Sugar phosphate isomerase n=1 Tax=Candidatus Enterococcus willemsii TaxID=1857215 RepID=A0ABQ6YXH9_9ENTE|nr:MULTISPECIES: sugar phosphate isomerase/epimerase [Enterococcus]KAF1302075.1 sugar phosphate isomerase [Enterococcus sp. CU12B]MCD5002818.1 sugar phosphate isomerase/epimerase [Enterococcus saccharolyticus]
MKPKIALQLWSIQEDCQKDFEAALRQVKEFGYDGVEFAGYYGKTADDIRAMLSDLDLDVAGSHVPYESLKNQLEATLDFEEAIGNRRIIVPYASFSTFAEWQEFMTNMQEIAKAVTNRGMKFYYHNHAHEFTEVEGTDLLDLLTHEIDQLLLEVDLYWLAHAGQDVRAWVEAHKSSIGLFHMKDKQQEPEESTELGSGVLPLKEYTQLAKKLQLPWLIVEQEAFQKYEPLEAAKINVKQLRAIIEEVYE